MIGILDSGLGGVSVLREIRTRLPFEAITYVGDCAFCPYGNKEPKILRERVAAIVEFLLSEGAQLIVLACNSATIRTIEWCRKEWPSTPFVGMEPGVKPAVEASKNGIVGVLATEASLTGEMFAKLVAEHSKDCQILTQACPDFVSLVEAGILEGAEVDEAIERYASELCEAGADVLVLGCTHYPFLQKRINTLFPQVHLINTGPAVAERVTQLLPKPITFSSSEPGLLRFFSSDCSQKMAQVLTTLWPEGSPTINCLPEKLTSPC